MADDAVPGARVKVRFAGQDVDGFVLARAAESAHPGRLMPLRRVVSAEPVLTPEIAALTGEIAARWAGTRSDVLRLAVPPRHATTEKQPSPPAPDLPAAGPDPLGAVRRGSGAAGRPGRGRVATRGLVLPAGRRLGAPARRGRRRHRAVRPRRPAVRARPPRRDPARRRADGAGRRRAPRRADRRRRAGEALRGVPGGRARRGPDRDRHPRGGVRAAARPRPGRGVGRRRRPLRRAPRALLPHPRRAAPARPADRVRGHRRGSRPERRGAVPAPHRLGAGGGRPPRHRSVPGGGVGVRRDRLRPRARPAGPQQPAAAGGAPGDRGRAQVRAGAGADPAGGLRDPAGLRPLPHPGRAARCATVRCGSRPPARCRPAPGAAPTRPAGPAPSAGATGCARRCSATGARPRSWGGRSPARRSARRPATGCSPRVGAEPGDRGRDTGRRAGRRRRLRDAWRCSTPGCCWPAPTCAPTRRRCAAGATPPRWCARCPTAAAWSWSATRERPAVQALVRWDPGGFAERLIAERLSAHLPPGVPGGDPDRDPGGAGGASRPRWASRRARRCSDRYRCRHDRDRPRQRRRPAPGWCSGCRAPRGRRCPRRWPTCSAAARPASSRHVRVEVDPIRLG